MKREKWPWHEWDEVEASPNGFSEIQKIVELLKKFKPHIERLIFQPETA